MRTEGGTMPTSIPCDAGIGIKSRFCGRLLCGVRRKRGRRQGGVGGERCDWDRMFMED